MATWVPQCTMPEITLANLCLANAHKMGRMSRSNATKANVPDNARDNPRYLQNSGSGKSRRPIYLSFRAWLMLAECPRLSQVLSTKLRLGALKSGLCVL